MVPSAERESRMGLVASESGLVRKARARVAIIPKIDKWRHQARKTETLVNAATSCPAILRSAARRLGASRSSSSACVAMKRRLGKRARDDNSALRKAYFNR